jgi:hypothetical protein
VGVGVGVWVWCRDCLSCVTAGQCCRCRCC